VGRAVTGVEVVVVTTIKNKMEIEICHILIHKHNISFEVSILNIF